jgi:hypothetical protein
LCQIFQNVKKLPIIAEESAQNEPRTKQISDLPIWQKHCLALVPLDCHKFSVKVTDNPAHLSQIYSLAIPAQNKTFLSGCWVRPKKKICGFPVSSYKNLRRVGRFNFFF